MTLDDIVKEIDELLKEEAVLSEDWEDGWNSALKYLRKYITGDFGNVN